ncbi:MATE family efflux transporter [Alteribacillus sp. JSM 102045]|uniref:MATE family efflux transporter n=1 Tax=Alteribacillus sp. JSM 102045 TaxID=1562101 RepID=UPI0035BFB862
MRVMPPIIITIITKIGMYSMNMFDTMMTGRAGPDELAGVAIGASIWVRVITGFRLSGLPLGYGLSNINTIGPFLLLDWFDYCFSMCGSNDAI